jgi:NTE family protein
VLNRSPRRAVVFSGGGARGAYEAGVLRFLFEDLQRSLGRVVAPEIALGTSVGAIHACYLAATAEGPRDRWSRLRQHWLSLDLRQFLRIDPLARWRASWRARRAPGGEAGALPARVAGLLNTAAVDRLIRDVVPWEGIGRNFADGRIHALGVITTELASGRAIVFAQGQALDPALWSHDRSVEAREARLGVEHVLASAAIPLLFPAVRIGSRYHVDGSVRLNTPLAPAIHLGAERMLVVALRSEVGDEARESEPDPAHRGFPAVLGRVLGALLLDRLDADLGRMHFVNSILERGARLFGPEFLPRLNQDGGRALRRIDALVVRPSQKLGELARQIARRRRGAPGTARSVRLFLDLVGDAETGSESDLLSLLLFDPEYFEALMDLGWRDARAREAELAGLFGG